MNAEAPFVDVVVMGGGAAGTIAALAAREAGADVLLVERDARPFGTTGMSMGLICAAGTRAQARHGVADDGDTFLTDILAKTREQTDPALARAIAFGSGPALDWLVEHHDLPLDLDLRFRPSYGNSRFRVHGWPGHNGEDLIALLHRRCVDADVMVMLGSKVCAVHSAPGRRVGGVELVRPDGSVETVRCGALVLASGGFAANADMVSRHIPEIAGARNNGHEGSQGDGIRLARDLGAAVADLGAFQGYAMLAVPHGISVPPGFLVEGGILVNAAGKRFVDELQDIAGMVFDVLGQAGAQAYVIYDRRIEQANAYQPDATRLADLNAPKRAGSAHELARLIGADANALATTLHEAHAAHQKGLPDRFGRRWDPDLSPPGDALAALRVTGAIYHTQGGIQIDPRAHVMHEDGAVFANLFAGGGTARSVSGPASWGYLPAMGLCTAMTFGRLAGEGAARASAVGR